jgi:hypothetical protein
VLSISKPVLFLERMVMAEATDSARLRLRLPKTREGYKKHVSTSSRSLVASGTADAIPNKGN